MHRAPYSLHPGFGAFCSKGARTSKTCTCNELYCIEGLHLGHKGGPVLNTSGEVIGIICDKSFCLPSNLIIRWWSAYKSSGEFRRPSIGIEVANLADTDLDFLAEFMPKFPDISSALIVTTVLEDSEACRAGIQTRDVIVKLNGKRVRSKSEFYDVIWENVGKAVTFILSRMTTGEELSVTVLIDETSPDKFYQWPIPNWIELR
ncbi:hypothetical protein RND81_05G027700 [Saponaria officinalis]|uniref:PDZ domain-containing protein n=1 Tax=Saponaria officinalis TaxID=3572 RepID=A0AAW1KTK6_SAPOF